MGIFARERNAGMNVRDKEQPNATRSKVAETRRTCRPQQPM